MSLRTRPEIARGQPVIRPILASELLLLKDFAPKEWNTDLSAIFSFHFGQKYYYPIVAEVSGEVVGCAQGLVSGGAGWLGNIVVLPDYRGRGIGFALTDHLIQFLRSRGCTSLILIATPLGEPVYRKLGFETATQYVFFKRDEPCAAEAVSGIRKLAPRDAAAVFDLDAVVTGEERRELLAYFLIDGWVHESTGGQIDGFFLPRFAHGPILAAA